MRSATFLSRTTAEAWRTSQRTPAPAAPTRFLAQQPRVLPAPPRPAPTRYARLSWHAAAFVAWVLVGTLLAKAGAGHLAP